jgi:hypothetical protein
MSYRPEAWAAGEEALFAVLVQATSATREQTAFKGFLPPQLDTWALNVSGGSENSTMKDMPPTEIKFDGLLAGQYSPGARDRGQQTALHWLSALPYRQDAHGPVYGARATSVPACVWGYVPVIKDGKEIGRLGCWLVTLDIEVVIRTHY